MCFSNAALFVTGTSKVAITGMPTPTVSPCSGRHGRVGLLVEGEVLGVEAGGAGDLLAVAVLGDGAHAVVDARLEPAGGRPGGLVGAQRAGDLALGRGHRDGAQGAVPGADRDGRVDGYGVGVRDVGLHLHRGDVGRRGVGRLGGRVAARRRSRRRRRRSERRQRDPGTARPRRRGSPAASAQTCEYDPWTYAELPVEDVSANSSSVTAGPETADLPRRVNPHASRQPHEYQWACSPR